MLAGIASPHNNKTRTAEEVQTEIPRKVRVDTTTKVEDDYDYVDYDDFIGNIQANDDERKTFFKFFVSAASM